MGDSKTRLIEIALDLLRESGLIGAGINQVVEASGAPKGSVYYYFPNGKNEMVAAALALADERTQAGLKALFSSDLPLDRKVAILFDKTAESMEATNYKRGCPVAAVTLDLSEKNPDLQAVCGRIFQAWRKAVEEGLTGMDETARRDCSEAILAALEGALILARSQNSAEPIRSAGRWLALAIKSLPTKADHV